MTRDKRTEDEWDDLGYYYEYDKDLKQWRFLGSKNGLKAFSKAILNYAINDQHIEISEHIHLGPYNYLKIMTWHNPVITENHIGGALKDLLNLEKLLSEKIESVSTGQIFKISSEYSQNNEASLVFIVMADDFIPSSIEF